MNPAVAAAADTGEEIRQRLGRLDWTNLEHDLNAFGRAIAEKVLPAEVCRQLAAGYDDDKSFRSRIVMARHGFGRGEYQYFDYPLPAAVTELRTALYPALAAIANRWNQALGLPLRYPEEHAEFLARCHQAGQSKPTPLLLQYGPGDYNCLHQDIYGEHVFPLQVAFLLSQPEKDFSGGEFVLTERTGHGCVPPFSKGTRLSFGRGA